MRNGTVIVRGVVRGKTIELEQAPDLPEGLVVSVVLRPAVSASEGLRRAFGAWAEDSEGFDEFLEGIYRDRDDDRPESRR